MRFMGLGGYRSLPFSVFMEYLHLLKSTNVDIETVYKNIETEKLTMSYTKVMKGFKKFFE